MNARLKLLQEFAEEQARLGTHSDIGSGCDLQDLLSIAMEDQRFIELGLHRGSKGMVAFGEAHGDEALCRFLGLGTKSNGAPLAVSLNYLHGRGGIVEIQHTIELLIKRNSR